MDQHLVFLIFQKGTKGAIHTMQSQLSVMQTDWRGTPDGGQASGTETNGGGPPRPGGGSPAALPTGLRGAIASLWDGGHGGIDSVEGALRVHP